MLGIILKSKEQETLAPYSLNLCNYSQLSVLKELDDIANLGTVGHLFPDLIDGIEERRVAVEYQTVGISQMLEHLFVGTVLTPDKDINATIL